MRSPGAVASIIHSMKKFPTTNGIASTVTNKETLKECQRIEEAQGPTPEGRVMHPRIRASEPKEFSEKEGIQIQEMELPKEKYPEEAEPFYSSKRGVAPEAGSKGKDEPVEAPEENTPPEKVIVDDDYPDQPITIRGSMSVKCRTKLIKVLRKHAYAFAWVPTDMTGIPRFVVEHQLKTYPHIEPRVQKKRSLASYRRKVVREEV
ncbi:hypothetical protein Tco_0041263 [Tanacetum coccineum]